MPIASRIRCSESSRSHDPLPIINDYMYSCEKSKRKAKSWKDHLRCTSSSLITIIFVFSVVSFYYISNMIMHDDFSTIQGKSIESFRIKPPIIQLRDRNGLGVSSKIKTTNRRGIDKNLSLEVNFKREQLLDDESPYDKEDKMLANCVSLGDWQSLSYPNCNILHEFNLSENSTSQVGQGAYREVWAVPDMTGEIRAMKTLLYKQSYDLYYFWRHLQRHSRDAIAMERLTSSPHIVDIYGFCGNGGLYDYGDGGSLNTYRRLTDRDPFDDIRFIIQAAEGLADFHSIDEEGRATIVHNDIKPNQFISINGVYKLNDFNKSMFLKYDKDTGISCPNKNKVPSSTGTFRSPEEYSKTRLDEKVDVYALGNTIFTILTGHWPWPHLKNKEVHKNVRSGEHSPLPKAIIESKNKYTRALIEAMEMCLKHKSSERASAREVQMFLKSML